MNPLQTIRFFLAPRTPLEILLEPRSDLGGIRAVAYLNAWVWILVLSIIFPTIAAVVSIIGGTLLAEHVTGLYFSWWRKFIFWPVQLLGCLIPCVIIVSVQLVGLASFMIGLQGFRILARIKDWKSRRRMKGFPQSILLSRPRRVKIDS